MRPFAKVFALWALLSCSVFGQFNMTVEVEQVEAVLAKSARIEPLSDHVAVFLTEREPGQKQGVILRIKTDAKWVSLYCEGQTLTRSQASPTDWIMFAPPAKYTVLIAQSDPEKGLSLEGRPVEVLGPVVPPPPDEPPPSDGDFTAVAKTAKEAADQLDDPATRQALALAYKTAVAKMAGKTYPECLFIAKSARTMALRLRQGASRYKDWESWLVAVDAELTKAVEAGDAAGYAEAITAIYKAIE